MLDKSNLVKILGVVTSVAGVILSLTSDWVTEQKMEERIDEKVNAAIAKKYGENEES